MVRLWMVLALALAGCASSEERKAKWAAEDDSTCQSYGAKPGTDAYVQCRMVQQARRDEMIQGSARSVGAGMQEFGRALQDQAKERRGTSCTTRRVGDTAVTDCN